MSDALQEGTINFWFRPGATAPTRPTAVFMRLWSTAPNEAGTGGTEISGSGYAAQDVTSQFGAPTQVSGAAQSTNASNVDFPEVISSGYTVNAVTLHTAATGGTLLAISQDTAMALVVAIGERVRVLAGAAALRVRKAA